MKNFYFFSSRLYVFLTELPLILLLVVAIRFNSASESLLKLYPLIVFTVGMMIFIMLYFVRGIKINADEVRAVGLFSSRDYVLLKDDSRILITDKGAGNLKVEVFGINDHSSVYNWKRNDTPDEINLFRATAIGSSSKIKKLLRFYGFSADVANEAVESESYTAESLLAKLTVTANEDIKEYNLALIPIEGT